MALKRKRKKAAKTLKRRHAAHNASNNSNNRLISVIILVFIAVFIGISVLFGGGGINGTVRNAVMSVFGTFGYLLPVVIIIAITLSLFYEGKTLNVKMYALLILYIMIICIVDYFKTDYSAKDNVIDTINEAIILARENSFSLANGTFSAGAIGTAITFVTYKAIREASIAAFITVAIISFILLFGTTFPMMVANAFKSIFTFIFRLPSRLNEKREEDRQIAIDNERILKETYEKSKKGNLQVSFDKNKSDNRLVLEPLENKKKYFDTSNIHITPSDIASHFYDAEKAKDVDTDVRPQSHLLKELRKKSINEVIYEEKEKGNTDSKFFYTDGMKPIDELDKIVLYKPIKEETVTKAPIIKNEYDEATDDSIYNADNKNFASGLDDLKRTETIDKTDSIKTLENITKDGLELKNNTIKDDDIVIKPKKKFKKYKFPPLNLLNRNDKKAVEKDPHLNEKATILVETLKTFGIGATLLNITVGPAVTRYELRPDVGVKISKILSLENDLQLALAASSLKIEAPIPGKAAIGIEIANEKSSGVLLGDLLATSEFRNAESKLTVAIGKDISGKNIITDLRKMPHLLIAGATGSGKSVCVNSLITSLIYKSSPEDVRMIMVDPKVVELQIYNGIPHLLVPVVTDPKKAANALSFAVKEMMRRYNLIQEKRVRDIESYNQVIMSEMNRTTANSNSEDEENHQEKLPYIVIIIDEFADLMLVASKDVENSIMRIAQLARACGIYLVIATQRPSVNVISGSIKTNVPSRISFAVASGVDSQTILDRRGAEKLLGHGDMLYFPSGIPEPIRVQGTFVSEEEILNIVDYVKDDTMAYDTFAEEAIDKGVSASSSESKDSSDRDEKFVEAGRLIVEKKEASIGMIQRRFAMGFNRAARIIDQLESEGVIAPQDGKKSREVLMSIEEFNEKFGA